MEEILQQLQAYLIFNPEAPLIFNTGLFLVLFTAFYAVYILTKDQKSFRIIYVLLFSLFFYYKSSGLYFVLLIISTVWDYFLGLAMYRCDENQRSKRSFYLILSMIGNLGMLGFYKYSGLLTVTINSLMGTEIPVLDLVLPVGISFFTFQTMSYSIDVYRGDLKPSKNILEFAFFVSFFPQLVAGPIVRAKDFLPQIRENLGLNKKELGYAFWLIIGGLFKKAIISDYISVNFVDRIFANPLQYSGAENLLAVYGYTIQIYCDFSGYSDMAIGLALLMGFRLPPNFNAPYQSLSITEFWRRWHISLSSWLRDYLYISLGGNRRGSFGSIFFILVFAALFYMLWPSLILLSIYAVVTTIALLYANFGGETAKNQVFTYLNLSVTMLLGGLWHGASWRFVVWGALHGGALALERMLKPMTSLWKGNILMKALGWFWTFHFVAFCWIYFRAPSFQDANSVIWQIAYNMDFAMLGTVISGYYKVFILLGIGYLIHFFPPKFEKWLETNFSLSPWPVQGVVLAFYIWLTIQIAGTDVHPFIYFQF
jgi:alginate O-acetyltransferase complex protein AlgI